MSDSYEFATHRLSSRSCAGSWAGSLLVVAAGKRRPSTFALVGRTGKGNVRRRRDGDVWGATSGGRVHMYGARVRPVLPPHRAGRQERERRARPLRRPRLRRCSWQRLVAPRSHDPDVAWLVNGFEARGDGRRGVGVSQSTAEAGELSPRDPVEGRGHRQVAPLEGKTANTPRVGPVSTSRHRIAELARHALGMAVAIAWLPGPAGTRRRVAKPSVEEPDAAEPARPDLWGARVSNDPGLPDVRQAWRAAPCLALSTGRRKPTGK